MVGLQQGNMITTDLETVLASHPDLNPELLRLVEPLAH
jgi:hypothetical protein